MERVRRHLGTTLDSLSAIRAHGNAAEYIPLFVALFLYLNSASSSTYIVVAKWMTLGDARDPEHASRMKNATEGCDHGDYCGALGTYICLFLLGFALFQRAL